MTIELNLSKYIPLIIIQFFLCVTCFSQREKIDSLSNILSSLTDTSRIDCLNALSHEYIVAFKKDSASYYAGIAYEEAIDRNYIYGIAKSYYNQAKIAGGFTHDVIKSERLTRQGLKWYEQTLDKRGISDLYNQLAVIVGIQSRYDESIAYSKKAYEYAVKAGDMGRITESLFTTGQAYLESGEYEKAFHFLQKAYQKNLEIKDHEMISLSLFTLGQLYMYTGNYNSALIYFRNGFRKLNIESLEDMKKTTVDIWFKMEFAETFAHLGQFDSAWQYFNLFKPSGKIPDYNRIYLVSTGECYYLQKNYSRALDNFLSALPEHEKLNDRNQVMRTLIGISKSSLELNMKSMALKYARTGLDLATTTKAIRYKRDAYQILYLLYDKRGIKDSANFYFREYRNVNDTVINEQTRANLAAQLYKEKIALLDKEKQLRVQELKQSAIQKRVMLFAIIGLLLFGFILIRNIILKRKNEKQRLEHDLEIQKLESERTKADLQQQATELEMQALRAQMNPHFVFNSLNSINRFILQNNKTQASEYLTKFSRLVRLILQNSQQALIPLESELESLKLYLELEAARFDHHFEFKIKVDTELETDIINVPPLIIQPFTENAIWHGLMHKEEKGKLEIELFQEDDMLCCKITDDGVGRKKAAELKSKSASTHKSMGMQITASRIEMLQQKKQSDAFIKITDLVLADGSVGGTEVLLKIPVM